MWKTMLKYVLAVVAIAVLNCPAPVFAEEAQAHDEATAVKAPARKPFLVAGKMPHLTGVIKQHWDDPALDLTPDQKEALLEIRKATMSAVMGAAKKLEPLESSLAEQAMNATPPDQLAPLVDTIAGLKTEATMAHLKCIHDTIEVLDERQLATLLEMSEAP